MERWQYGMALYQRNANKPHPKIDCRQSELPMEDIDDVQTQLGLLRFLKEAGSKGWELCSSIAPWAEGQRLSDEKADGKQGKEYIVKDRFDIQWLLFKRPMS